MTEAMIYAITQTDQRDHLGVAEAGHTRLAADYDSMTTIEINGQLFLVGYSSSRGQADLYILHSDGSGAEQHGDPLDLGTGWDVVEPFYLANQPHFACYQAKNGHICLYPISVDLQTEGSYLFYHYREPLTTNATVFKPLVAEGRVFILTYNEAHGDVNAWTISATSRSAPGHPPLRMDNAWAHRWAQGWTRFAFFTWGNENFFLKTNLDKEGKVRNVNIDHISNELSSGTNEVGSHLQDKLKDAQFLTIVHPFMVGPGEPYFLTYRADTGESTFNRIHGDCLGWTTCATIACPPHATHIVPYRIGDVNFALYVAPM